MSKKNILFIKGTADDKNVQLLSIRKDGSASLQHTGSANIYEHIQSDLFDKTLLIFDTNPKQEIRGIRFDAVFNQISDPDTHKIALLKAEGMHAQLPQNMPFFNRPENIKKTTRENIYQLLQEVDKLHVPKTVRIQPKSPSDIYDTIDKEDFEFPIIFRQAGDHGGISTIRVDDKTEQFYAFPLDERDYYLTKFVEYANTDGIYTKYRLVVVDSEVFIRHAIFSDNWVIHSNSRKFMKKDKKYQQIEEEILNSFETEIKPKIQSIINAIYSKLELDYFGIDCYIDDQFNMTIFEINANMNVLSNSYGGEKSIWNEKVELIKNAITKMIEKKLHT